MFSLPFEIFCSEPCINLSFCNMDLAVSSLLQPLCICIYAFAQCWSLLSTLCTYPPAFVVLDSEDRVDVVLVSFCFPSLLVDLGPGVRCLLCFQLVDRCRIVEIVMVLPLKVLSQVSFSFRSMLSIYILLCCAYQLLIQGLIRVSQCISETGCATIVQDSPYVRVAPPDGLQSHVMVWFVDELHGRYFAFYYLHLKI